MRGQCFSSICSIVLVFSGMRSGCTTEGDAGNTLVPEQHGKLLLAFRIVSLEVQLKSATKWRYSLVRSFLLFNEAEQSVISSATQTDKRCSSQGFSPHLFIFISSFFKQWLNSSMLDVVENSCSYAFVRRRLTALTGAWSLGKEEQEGLCHI